MDKKSTEVKLNDNSIAVYSENEMTSVSLENTVFETQENSPENKGGHSDLEISTNISSETIPDRIYHGNSIKNLILRNISFRGKNNFSTGRDLANIDSGKKECCCCIIVLLIIGIIIGAIYGTQNNN